MDDWTTCPSCDEEFKIVSDSMESPLFCPFCGEDLPDELDDLFDDEEDE